MFSLLACLAVAASPAATRFNAFGLAVMKARGEVPGNVLFSPLSASAAMSLLLEASSGRTETEIRGVMQLGDVSTAAVTEEAGALLRSLATSPGQEVSLANAIFAPSEMPLGEAFVRDVQTNFGATIERLRDGDGAGVAQVNQWVATSTKQRITHILDSLARGSAVLANAVTFDGKWAVPFPTERTVSLPFHAVDGDQSTQMMQRTGMIPYRELPDHREVELPYLGDQFAMRVMLPNAGDPVAILNSTPADPAQPGPAQMVELMLPRFSFSASADLKEPLTRMGLGSIFVHANVARMVPSRTPMKVGKVVQKTWIQVDESGTKAAAATTIQIRPTAIFGGHRQVIQFHVDRPFAFTIEDRKSGAILFAGVVRRVP